MALLDGVDGPFGVEASHGEEADACVGGGRQDKVTAAVKAHVVDGLSTAQTQHHNSAPVDILWAGSTFITIGPTYKARRPLASVNGAWVVAWWWRRCAHVAVVASG